MAISDGQHAQEAQCGAWCGQLTCGPERQVPIMASLEGVDCCRDKVSSYRPFRPLLRSRVDGRFLVLRTPPPSLQPGKQSGESAQSKHA